MDPIEVFKKVFKHINIMQIEGKWMIQRHDKYFPLESDCNFRPIKNCIEERKKNPQIFRCGCGQCSAVLLGQLHEQLYSPKITLSPFVDKKAPSPFDFSIPIKEEHKITEPFLFDNVDAPCFYEAQRKKEPEPPKKEAFIPCFQKLTFGKHKDKTFAEVFEKDKPYCIWCIETEAITRAKGELPSSTMSLFVSYVKSRICAS
jgi:hypothetical protein